MEKALVPGRCSLRNLWILILDILRMQSEILKKGETLEHGPY